LDAIAIGVLDVYFIVPPLPPKSKQCVESALSRQADTKILLAQDAPSLNLARWKFDGQTVQNPEHVSLLAGTSILWREHHLVMADNRIWISFPTPPPVAVVVISHPPPSRDNDTVASLINANIIHRH
jgi:hypothetical protein